KHFGAEPRDVVPRGRCRHHLNRAACQPEPHRPDGRFARPVEHAIDARCDEIVLEPMVDETHTHMIYANLIVVLALVSALSHQSSPATPASGGGCDPGLA